MVADGTLQPFAVSSSFFVFYAFAFYICPFACNDRRIDIKCLAGSVAPDVEL